VARQRPVPEKALSALAFPASKSDQILERVRRRDLQLVISPFILEETERVLVHKFGLSPGATAGLIRDIEDLAEVVHPTERLRLVTVKDDDNQILECVVAGQAHVLVTGDKRHLLPLGSIGETRIVSASDLLAALDASS
jgi:uncharacterized protein